MVAEVAAASTPIGRRLHGPSSNPVNELPLIFVNSLSRGGVMELILLN
jgi:hypothetical protein